MIIARRLTALALLLASAALLVAYGRAALWGVGLTAAVAPASLWLVGFRRAWSWPAHVGFMLYAAFSAGAGLRAEAPWLALLAMLAALTAWDLTAWQLRLAGARLEDVAGLLNHHLRRLTAVLLVSVALFGLTRLAALRLTLWSAIFLGALLVLALYQTARLLRRAGES